MKFRKLLSMFLVLTFLICLLPTVGYGAETVTVGSSFTYTKADNWGMNDGIWSWQWALADSEDFSDMAFTTVEGQGEDTVF